jgi:transposase
MSNQNTGIRFENQVFFIGIDVHKLSWTVTIRTNHMELKTYMMNPSPEELAKSLNRHYPGGVYKSAYEAGFCGFWIHKRLIENGIENIVVNAADIPTTHKEKVTKTDKVDSRKIAKKLEINDIKGIFIPTDSQQQIRSLCRLRHSATNHSTRLKNRIKGHLHFYGISTPSDEKKWSANFIRHLESLCEKNKPGAEYLLICLDELKEQRKRILHITRSLRKYVNESEKAKYIISCLRSIPGIGFVTAITLYTEIMDIHRFFTPDHLAAFVGLSPSGISSGENETITGLNPRRNRYLRHLIIEAAWIAVRHDPALLKSYTNLTKRMKNSKAIIRIARKLLNRIRFVWKQQQEYKCAA